MTQSDFHARVAQAEDSLRALFPETPLQLNEHLSNIYGARIYLKREDLTPVRSYKIRGAFNFMRKRLAQGGRRRGSPALRLAITRRASPSLADTSGSKGACICP